MDHASRGHVFAIALGVSLAVHLGFGVALGYESLTRLLAPRPMVVPARRPPPEVRFTLVDTPESAATPAPPTNSPYQSNRNTRAQDRTLPSDAATDQPHIEERGASKDLRQVARAPTLGVPNVSEPIAAAMPATEPDIFLKPAPPAQLPTRPQPKPAKPMAVPRPPRRPEPVSQTEASPAPPVRAQRTPAVVTVAPPADTTQDETDARRAPQPEALVAAPPSPVQPAAEFQQLPKKDTTHMRRQLAKLERELLALRQAVDARHGRATLSAVEADELANARVEGEFSYGASQHFFGEYLLQMKAEVERHWVSRLVTEYTGLLHSRVTVDFKIYASGAVGDLHIVEASGNEIFPLVCVSSIKDAAPFPAVPYGEVKSVPRELHDKPLNIRFTFQYN